MKGFSSLGSALALNYSRLLLRCEFESGVGRSCEKADKLHCLSAPAVGLYSTYAPPRSNMAECGWRVDLTISS